MTRALITGISGQDGSYLAELLLGEGVEVHALHHSVEDPPAHCPDGVELHLGDVTDHRATRDLLLHVAPDEVYNLAAISSVFRSWDEPAATFDVNATAVAALLESARLCQERTGRPVRVLQASSAEIFGDPETSPQTEATPIRPTNPYGVAKAAAHHMVRIHRDTGLHAVAAILYNHESPRRPASFVTQKIATGVAEIAAGRADRLTLGNLSARRDWGWAPDHVRGMVRALRFDRPRDFVLATGQSHSVAEFAEAAFARAGISDWDRHVGLAPQLERPSDTPSMVGDASAARELLGWQPTLGFDEIVAAMVDARLADVGRTTPPQG